MKPTKRAVVVRTGEREGREREEREIMLFSSVYVLLEPVAPPGGAVGSILESLTDAYTTCIMLVVMGSIFADEEVTRDWDFFRQTHTTPS